MIDFSIRFDTAGKAESPAAILTTKGGRKIGLLAGVTDVVFKNSCENAPEMSFKIYKEDGDTPVPYWDDINMYKMIYVPEMNTYFSIECETNIGDGGVYKSLTLTRLAEAELSQIKVYGLQINTEQAIIMPDYDPERPVVLYRPEAELKDSSLLHKILSFAPHYSIGTVDASIRNIQRIFEFNGNSIMECFKTIAEEESVIFDFDCGANHNRVVNVHDALTSCNTCGFRGHFTGACPECGGIDINEGFGENTGILVSSESLGNNLTVTRNSEAISNCYHIAGGDDTMTAAIRSCNPNGGYIWSFSDEMKNEMSAGLKSAINAYEILYDEYQDTHVFPTTSLPVSDYNVIVNKYRELDSGVTAEPISTITGYSELIKTYYEAVDLGEYLSHSLMPSVTNNGTTAADVVAGLTTATLSPVSLLSVDTLTLAQASTAVVNFAKIKADPLYNIQVVSQSLAKSGNVYTWTGVLSATSYYDKADTANTDTLNIVVNDDLPNYAQNSVMQTLLNRSQGNSAIVGMYAMTDADLADALKYYCYQMLQSINDCFIKAVEMLTSIGADDPANNAHAVYVAVQSKLAVIAAELAVREGEVKTVDFKELNTCMTAKLWDMITAAISTMKIENNLTLAQWTELNAFRREADFSNDNYVSTSFRRKFDYTDSSFISDSLSNAELIKRAYEFILQAEYKIKENNKYSYSINTSLQNLLVINEFAGLRDGFKVGNWIRIMDDSGNLYKLRLIDYEINFEDLSEISVSFADVSLESKSVNKVRKFMAKTQNVVNRFDKDSNQSQSNLVQKGADLANDYAYSDAYNAGSSSQNIEILGNNVITQFNVLDGLIEGKISADQAWSIIRQAIDKITLQVNNGTKSSSITIKYDGVDIDTSGAITLGGTVIFTDDLTDGETVISGDNILTGIIKSSNFLKLVGATFSTTGSSFNLTTGELITPAVHIEGTEASGDEPRRAEFKDVYMESGWVGNSRIITEDDGNVRSLDHVNNAWKLRSSEINDEGTRYYTYMTKNKNLIVSNEQFGSHTADNDVTDQCNIGTYNYPWNKGYFNTLRVQHHNVIPEGLPVTLEASDWTQHASGYYTQTQTINGMSGDIYLYIATDNSTDLDLVYKHNIEVDTVSTNTVTFLAATLPSSAIDVVLLVEDFIYSAIESPELNAIYDSNKSQLSCFWSSPRDSSKFITWVKDELILEKYNSVNDTWEQVLVLPGAGEEPFEPDQFVDIPLVIGSDDSND